jgi:3-isopropylmalate/(R)-2-methylmalate dehydratase small subunit
LEKRDFVLKRPARGAGILLAGDNFGCGSSREHAPRALVQFGFRAVISTSFADIFKGNALKNSLLPIVVPREVHAKLFELVNPNPEATVKVDLAVQTVTLPDGTAVEFLVDGFMKHCLLGGIDELGYIQSLESEIAAYERAHPAPINTLVGSSWTVQSSAPPRTSGKSRSRVNGGVLHFVRHGRGGLAFHDKSSILLVSGALLPANRATHQLVSTRSMVSGADQHASTARYGGFDPGRRAADCSQPTRAPEALAQTITGNSR